MAQQATSRPAPTTLTVTPLTLLPTRNECNADERCDGPSTPRADPLSQPEASPGADEPNQRAFTLTPRPADNKASDEEAEVPLDIQSLQPELQDIAQSIMTCSPVVIPSTPNRPTANQMDEDFVEEPLDLNSLQPELQAIANSIPTNTSPAVRKLLLAAFQALQDSSRDRISVEVWPNCKARGNSDPAARGVT